MKTYPRLFLVVLGLVLCSGLGLAQERNVASATSALQDVLTTLKESAQKLALDNDQLEERDRDMKAQIQQFQMQLEQLNTQGDSLSQSVGKLKSIDSDHDGKIFQLQSDNADLDNRLQKSEGDLHVLEKSIDAKYEQEQLLLLHLKQLQKPLVSSPEIESAAYQASSKREKERLKLMKMIYDSQQRQASLHQSIMDLQQNAPLVPAAGALARQQLLKEQIKDLEDEISALPPEKFSGNAAPSIEWDSTQLGQLEAELKALEENYNQLKGLMGQMTQKSQTSQMTISQHVEENKLQANIEDLKRQGVLLTADLDDLRSQMVELDKRKSRLEAMVKHAQ